nr:MAG TPA: hypothetical protein [Caudoviricetes sp.]
MKAVMISIQPKWCEKIANGEKTIEVRKTTPDVPFKAYIYVTKGKPYLYRVDDDDKFELTNTLRPKTFEYVKDYNEQNGKIIGEFVCDRVYKWECKNRLEILESFPIWRASYMLFVDDLKETCLTYDDLWDYGKGKPLYGLHISELKIYDRPKRLSEFYTKKTCNSCKKSGYESTACMYDEDCKVPMPITRAPQSWQYVEEL